MTTLYELKPRKMTPSPLRLAERRQHRRHDLETQRISIERWDGKKGAAIDLGHIVDLSSGGMRIRTTQASIRPEQQIRVRLELPVYAGISPFVDTSTGSTSPKTHWTGWMAVSRIQKVAENHYDVAGRLVDMEDLDRGMLGLYLSTQPLAA
jgi:hypothetical protein